MDAERLVGLEIRELLPAEPDAASSFDLDAGPGRGDLERRPDRTAPGRRHVPRRRLGHPDPRRRRERGRCRGGRRGHDRDPQRRGRGSGQRAAPPAGPRGRRAGQLALGHGQRASRSGTSSSRRSTGMPPGGFDGTFEAWAATVHPDDHDAGDGRRPGRGRKRGRRTCCATGSLARRHDPVDRGARQGHHRRAGQPHRHDRLRAGHHRPGDGAGARGGRGRAGPAAARGDGGVLPAPGRSTRSRRSWPRASSGCGRSSARVSSSGCPTTSRRSPTGAAFVASTQRPLSHEDTPAARHAGLAVRDRRRARRAPGADRRHRRAAAVQPGREPAAGPGPVRSGGALRAREATSSSTWAVTGTTRCARRPATLALVVGDVMGRGVRAATTMIRVRAGIRGLLTVDPAPQAVLAAADEMMTRDAPDQFVTAAAVLVDPATGTLTLCNAGHVPVVVVHPDGRTETLGDGSGVPLGVPSGLDRTVATAPPRAGHPAGAGDGRGRRVRAPRTSTRASPRCATARPSCGAGRCASWSTAWPSWPTSHCATTSPSWPPGSR